MSDGFFIKFSPDDFLEGTGDLSDEVVGFYWRIVCRIYSRKAPIVADLKRLADFSNCSTRTAGVRLDALIAAGKLEIRDGKIHNRRADEVLAELSDRSSKRASAGAAGGRKSGEVRASKSSQDADSSPTPQRLEGASSSTEGDEKPADLLDFNDLGEANANQNRSKNEAEEKEKRKESKKDREDRLIEETFPAFWQSYPRKDDRKVALKAYAAAIRRGADPAVILAGARSYSRKRASEDPKFTKMGSTWLNNDLWENEGYTTGGSSQTFQGPDPAAILKITPAEWRAVQARTKVSGTWDFAQYGPAPWEKGCLVPKDLLDPWLTRPRGFRTINGPAEVPA